MMISVFISLVIVLGIVGLAAWGIAIIPAAPRSLVRIGHAVCAVVAAILVLNFILALTGHPLFTYGGTIPP